MARVKELASSIEGKSPEEKAQLLQKCAATTLQSKLVSGERDFFAKMVVDAVNILDPELLDLKVGGGVKSDFSGWVCRLGKRCRWGKRLNCWRGSCLPPMDGLGRD